MAPGSALILAVGVAAAGEVSEDPAGGERSDIRVSAGFFNDSQNGSLSPNRDDYRSFGFDFGVEYGDRFQITSTYSGLTNKDPEGGNGARIDELMTVGEFRVYRWAGLSVLPTIGFVVSGNLGGRTIQNSIHESTSEPIVTVPYEEESRTRPLYGYRLRHRTDKFYWGARKRIPQYFESSHQTWHAPGYAVRSSLDSQWVFGRPGADRLYLGLGGQFLHMPWMETGRVVAEQETGVRMRFGYDVAFLSVSFDVLQPSGFSSGRVGVNLFHLGREKRHFQEPDVIVDFNALLQRGGYSSRAKWRAFALSKHEFFASVSHTYGTYNGQQLPTHPLARGQYLQFDGGLETSLFNIEPRFQVNPFVGAGLGIRDEMSYSGDDPTAPSLHSVAPVGYFDVGLRVGGPLRALSQQSLIALQVGDRLTLPFYQDEQQQQGEVFRTLLVRNDVYVGFSFAVDL